VGVGVYAGFTVNWLLVPVWVPSVAVMVAAEPDALVVTDVVPTPVVKAFMVFGVIGPMEIDSVGLPT
jgi:hypothetical protein